MLTPEMKMEIDKNLTKDSKERLMVLPELKEKWNSEIEKWRKMNAVYIQKDILSGDEELMLYYIVVATFPLQTDAEYEGRLKNYLLNIFTETDNSGRHRDKILFSGQLSKLIDDIFSPHHSFFASLSSFMDEIVDYGIINSLAGLTIRLTSPGNEKMLNEKMRFDFSPPSNTITGKIQEEHNYASLQKFSGRNDRVQFINELWNKRRNGEIKHWLIVTLMNERNRQYDLFTNGGYSPLKVSGTKSKNILAFVRQNNADYFVTVVTRFQYSVSEKETFVDWENTAVELPDNTMWHNLIDDKTYSGTGKIEVNDLLKNFPVACLKKVRQ